MADFYILGIQECEETLRTIPRKFLERIGELLYDEAIKLLELTKARTPVKTGALRDSGFINQPQITNDEVSVTISFGSEVVTWAIPVHERTYVKHVTGRSKYLESVILEYGEVAFENIQKNLSL